MKILFKTEEVTIPPVNEDISLRLCRRGTLILKNDECIGLSPLSFLKTVILIEFITLTCYSPQKNLKIL